MKTCDECENAQWSGPSGRCRIAARYKIKPLPACMAFANLSTKEPGTIEDYLIRGEELPRHCPYYKPVTNG